MTPATFVALKGAFSEGLHPLLSSETLTVRPTAAKLSVAHKHFAHSFQDLLKAKGC